MTLSMSKPLACARSVWTTRLATILRASSRSATRQVSRVLRPSGTHFRASCGWRRHSRSAFWDRVRASGRVLAHLDAIACGSVLHIHQIGHQHGVGVEVRNDPYGAADDEKDDKHAEGEG